MTNNISTLPGLRRGFLLNPAERKQPTNPAENRFSVGGTPPSYSFKHKGVITSLPIDEPKMREEVARLIAGKYSCNSQYFSSLTQQLNFEQLKMLLRLVACREKNMVGFNDRVVYVLLIEIIKSWRFGAQQIGELLRIIWEAPQEEAADDIVYFSRIWALVESLSEVFHDKLEELLSYFTDSKKIPKLSTLCLEQVWMTHPDKHFFLLFLCLLNRAGNDYKEHLENWMWDGEAIRERQWNKTFDFVFGYMCKAQIPYKILLEIFEAKYVEVMFYWIPYTSNKAFPGVFPEPFDFAFIKFLGVSGYNQELKEETKQRAAFLLMLLWPHVEALACKYGVASEIEQSIRRSPIWSLIGECRREDRKPRNREACNSSAQRRRDWEEPLEALRPGREAHRESIRSRFTSKLQQMRPSGSQPDSMAEERTWWGRIRAQKIKARKEQLESLREQLLEVPQKARSEAPNRGNHGAEDIHHGESSAGPSSGPAERFRPYFRPY